MNKVIAIGFGAAAVVVALLIGTRIIGAPPEGLGVAPTATPTPRPTLEPTAATSLEPTSSADESLPEGPFAWPPVGGSEGPSITVSIPGPGWTHRGDTLSKGADGDGDLWGSGALPESAFLAMSTTAGIVVYEDPCQWAENVPEPAATTAPEIAAALAAQPSRDASDPVDMTVGGYPATVITLRVPDDAVFTECYRGVYATYTPEGWGSEGGGSLPGRVHQGPGQIDTFWIVEVDDAIVILNAMYRDDTPAERIEEMRAIAESATFEEP